MKILPCLLGLLLAPAALPCAAESTNGTAVGPGPAHPTVLTVAYKGDMLSVVKVIGTDPVVMVDGQEKRIRLQPVYKPDRTTDFGAGFVEVSAILLDGMSLDANRAPSRDPKAVVGPRVQKQYGAGSGGNSNVTESADDVRAFQDPAFGTGHFEAKLKSRQRLEGAFALVVVYPASLDSLQLPTKYAGPEFIVHDLPILPAGEEVTVKLSGILPRAEEPRNCFIQIFDSTGHEVRIDHSELASTYYRATDLLAIASAKEKYLKTFAGTDHPLVPLMQPPPVYPDEYTKPALPGAAFLTVSSDGQVTKVEVSGVDDARLRESLSEAFGGWLFLPRLKSGVPIDTKAKVPLLF